MKKILITGSSGFVGTNLYKSFYNDFELLGLDITNKGVFPVESVFSWEQLDKIPEVDVIIHLAGKAHDTSNSSNPQSYFDINLGLTQKIFDFFLQSKAKKFIYFSSVKAVAANLNGEILTEDAIPSPNRPYGQSKLAAEQYIQAELDKWQEGEQKNKNTSKNNESAPSNIGKTPIGFSDKQLYIFRPCMIHGAGNKGNLNLLYEIAKKGIPWPLGRFENQRSFVSIDNLSFVIRQFITKNIEPGIYQIADDEAVSTNELISLMAKAMGKKERIWNFSPKLIILIAKIGDLIHLPLNTDRLNKLTETYIVSNLKLKKALGIQKMPMDAKQGLLKTLKSFNA